MNVGQAVRERIAELCEEKHITINKLANISGITQSTLNNICFFSIQLVLLKVI